MYVVKSARPGGEFAGVDPDTGGVVATRARHVIIMFNSRGEAYEFISYCPGKHRCWLVERVS